MVDDLSHESVLKQGARLGFGDATLTHIEEGGFVHHAHRRAVCALHVVSIYLQHGLGVHTGVGRGTEIGVRLLRSGLLSVLVHENLASECADRLVVHDVFIEFVGGAVRHFVTNQCVVVNALRPTSDGTTIQRHLRVLALQIDVAEVAGLSVEERDAVVLHRAVAAFPDIDIREARAERRGLLNLVEVQTGIVVAIDLDDLGGEEALLVGSMVVDDDGGIAALLHDDEHAAVHHRGGSATQPVVHHDGVVHLRVLGHIHQQGIVHQCRVQCRDGIVRVSHLMIVGSHIDGRVLYIIYVRGRIDRQGRQRDAIVGGEGGIHVRVFVALHLLRGEAHTLECLKSLVAHGVHHRTALPLDQLARLAV